MMDDDCTEERKKLSEVAILANDENFLENLRKWFKDHESAARGKAKAAFSYPAKELIEKLTQDLFKDYDTSFFTDYCAVLETNNADLIEQVSHRIICSVEEALRQQRYSGGALGEWQAVTLAVWLSAALVWDAPQLPHALHTYHALLLHMDERHMERVARAWWSAADAAALLALADASRAPPAPRALAHALLRAALARLGASDAPPTWCGAPSAEEVCECAAAARGERAGVLLARVAARVLARRHSDDLLRALAALADRHAHNQRINQSVSNIRLVFGDFKRPRDANNTTPKRTRPRPRALT